MDFTIYLIAGGVVAIIFVVLAALGSTYCPHCKALITKGAKVCEKCGRDIKKEV